ncbi:TBC1 domain family member 31 [Merluccius polli]|uniref:TBC1 domain family member 31 n=1 Tax=Merluccius polli TaxID=89951 RepID=A0AA47NBY4_MERPO|nr:TBC1 domain family member 31 [Merluccius polli]
MVTQLKTMMTQGWAARASSSPRYQGLSVTRGSPLPGALRYQGLSVTRGSPLPGALRYQVLPVTRGSPLPGAPRYQGLYVTRCSPLPGAPRYQGLYVTRGSPRVAMQVTDIGDKEEGKIWHRKPAPNKSVFITVVRSGKQGKTVRFLHVTFDTTGESFLAGDHHGNIYVFDISRNRFRLVQKTGLACTSLAFSLRRTTEFLVALADYSIKCFDKVGCGVTRERSRPFLSTVPAATPSPTSCDTAQLWDLDTFQRKRKLNIRQSVGIQKVFFLPLGNTILSCFSDDSIFAWESDSLSCKYQLPVPEQGPRVYYKAFAVTRDGKNLAAGGRSNLLHLWCLDSRQLVRVLQMPAVVRTVRQLHFLPDSFDGGASQTLGVLSQDGVMRFINIHTCKLLFHMGSHDEAITTATVSPSGRHVVAIMDDGSINVYNVHSLNQDLNKPPPLRTAVVSCCEGNPSSNITVKVRSEAVQRPAKSFGRRARAKLLRPPAADSLIEDKENELPAGLNKKRLVALLQAFGEYPAKYRMFVWRSLLCLPENHAAYSSLTDKGLHAAYLTLHDKYPIKSHKLQRGLQRVLSALAHWAAIFGETEYLPLVAFPFVKLFQNNPLLCFEVVATVIVNWCQHWFEYFPNPPLNVLSMAENVLAHHDAELLQHLVDCGITSQLYVWPLLETLFSEVLTRDEWLRLFDNVFSNHPCFLLLACVAYVTCCRAPLLLCSHKQDFEYFFHHRNNLDMGAMVKESYRLMASTPTAIHPRALLADFSPLTRAQYPVFNHYPEVIVQYHSRERERIRQQELEYLRERQAVSELRADCVLRQASEEAYYAQQELLQQAEDQRRHILAQEEEKLTQQRTNIDTESQHESNGGGEQEETVYDLWGGRLGAMKRELKVKELRLLDTSRRRFLTHQQQLRTSHIRRLDRDIGRKMDLREQETAAAVQDLEIRQIELETQRKQLEQELLKEQERVGREVEEEVEVRMRRDERDEEEHRHLLRDAETNLQALEESLAEACQLGLDRDWEREVGQRLERLAVDGERKRERLAELHTETLCQQDRLLHTVRDMHGWKWDEVMTARAQLQEQTHPLYSTNTADTERPVRLRSPRSTRGLPPRPSAVAAVTQPHATSAATANLRHSSSTATANLGHATSTATANLGQAGSRVLCLNSPSPPGSTSTNYRGRAQLDSGERQLMREVRELRQKLASAKAEGGRGRASDSAASSQAVWSSPSIAQ